MRPYPGELLLHLESYCALLRHMAVRRKGVFERAAAELHVDRSVLRRRMQTLQEWVGTPLLEGRGASLAPTTSGLRLRDAATRLLRDVDGLPALAVGGPRRLRLGCTGTVTTELLPPVLTELDRRQPPLIVSVRRAGSALCRRWLDEGEIDLGVMRGGESPRGLDAVRLCEDRLWLVLPRRHPLLASRAPSPERMARERLILYASPSQTRARVLATLGAYGAEVAVEVDGKSSAIEYVRRGLGITFLSLLPRHRVTAPGVVLRDVSRAFAPSAFWLVRRVGLPESAELRELVASMRRHAKPLAGRRASGATSR